MAEDPTVPQRPQGERPDGQRAGRAFGAFGPPGLGYPQLVGNIGLLPSLFGITFVSIPLCPLAPAVLLVLG